jgi:4'-phosphopantetheinyl transferase
VKPTQADILELNGKQVHAWYFYPTRVSDARLIDAYQTILSQEELARQQRFIFAEDRHQFLIAHACVRLLLSRYAQVHPSEWQFKKNPHGRPEIAWPEEHRDICFNLSHTRGLIALVIARDRQVGIDVENTQRAGIMLDLARRYFSTAEVAQLERQPPELQRELFFDFWTLKESYLKARGLGIFALSLSDFSFYIDAEGGLTLSFAPTIDDQASRWQFERIRLGGYHKMAVAIECQNTAA